MLIPVVIFAVLLLAVIILLQNLDVKIEYVLAEKGSGQVNLIIFLFRRLLRLKYKFDLGKATKIEGPRAKEKESLVEIYKRFKKAYKEHRSNLARIFHCAHIRELNISVYPATGDACSTGMLSGLIWTLIGSIDALLTSYAIVDKRNIVVLPEYVSDKTRVDASCIIKLKIVNIILIVILLKRYIVQK